MAASATMVTDFRGRAMVGRWALNEEVLMKQIVLIPGLRLAARMSLWTVMILVGGCWNAESDLAGKRGATGDNSEPLFAECSDELGLRFVHDPGPPGNWFYPEIMIMGAALLDIDQDGDLDIYLLNCGTPPVPGRVRESERARNQLFQQRDDGTFVDITANSGLGDTGYSVGVAVGDINNDGLPDVFVTNYGQDRLYRNLGAGRFQDITEAAGIDNRRWSAAACFIDYDRDGWLDLYVANYVDYFPSRDCFGPSGRRDYCGPASFEKTTDRLYHNITGGLSQADAADSPASVPVRFRDESVSTGIAAQRGSGLGVIAWDCNDDGWQDIYVANDMVANFLWINGGDGTFRDEAMQRGVAYDGLGRPQASMGLALADVNHDQVGDLYVTHMAGEMNALYMSLSDQGYREMSMQTGAAASMHALTTFGTAFLDIDLDGREDLVAVNGSMKLPDNAITLPAGADSAAFWDIFTEPNTILMNSSSDKFRPYRSRKDAFLAIRDVGRGLCIGDLDNDGDLDLLTVSTAAPARLFRNVAKRKGNWLKVRAIEPTCGNRDAYGARVVVRAGDQKWTRWISPGASYLCSHDPVAHFGIGAADRVTQINVRWPDGSEEQFDGCPMNRLVVLAHGKGQQP